MPKTELLLSPSSGCRQRFALLGYPLFFRNCLTSPFIRCILSGARRKHGAYETATAGLRLHRRFCTEKRLLAFIRKNWRRHGLEFAGHGAQANLQPRKKRPAAGGVKPPPPPRNRSPPREHATSAPAPDRGAPQ